MSNMDHVGMLLQESFITDGNNPLYGKHHAGICRVTRR